LHRVEGALASFAVATAASSGVFCAAGRRFPGAAMRRTPMQDIRLPETPGGDHWLAMDVARLYRLTEDARRCLCRDWSERTLRLRHLMKIVLFHQFDALRGAVRFGAIAPDDAATGMRSDFGLGYLAGLATDHADACGLPLDSGIAAAGRLDLHLFAFGLVEGQRLLAAAPPAGEAFEQGRLVAEWDVETYKSWLEGAEEEPTLGLRDGLMRRAAGPVRPAWVGWA
jgi:hypothetical protein